MPLMGLDYGAKTVGVAVSDGLGLAAQPLETIWRDSEKKRFIAFRSIHFYTSRD